VGGGEFVERLVHGEQLLFIRGRDNVQDFEVQTLLVTTVAQGALAAGFVFVDQDAPHGLGGGREEVGAVFELGIGFAGQPQSGLMEQRRGLQGLLAARHPKNAAGNDCARIAAAPKAFGAEVEGGIPAARNRVASAVACEESCTPGVREAPSAGPGRRRTGAALRRDAQAESPAPRPAGMLAATCGPGDLHRALGQALRQLGMAAIAERPVLGMLAAAPGHRLGFGNIHFRRGKAGAFVRAIAKGLPFG